MIRIFGIPNCDTCKKARGCLDQNEVTYEFVDVRKTPLDANTLDEWISAVSWQTLLNRRSTSWRSLSERDKSDLNSSKVRTLILANPTLMKRPVCVSDGEIHVGFDAKTYQHLSNHG